MAQTRLLCDYIAGARLSDFPAEIVLMARHYIQNVIGCALGGAQTELGKRHLLLGKDLGGQPESTLIGDGARISCVNAAHTNTDVSNALDYDDGHRVSLSHPGCPIVCSALAVAEAKGASGKDFLTAVILGYDVGVRIARAMHSTIVTQAGDKELMQNMCYEAPAVATVAGKLLGFKAGEMNNLFGIVGNIPVNWGQSPVHPVGTLPTSAYTDVKYNEGVYALIGVFGAFRSRRLEGIRDALDDGQVWERAWTGWGKNRYDSAELTKDLGKEFRIKDVYLKQQPMCGMSTRVYLAVQAALKGEKLAAKDIEEITLIGVPKLQYYTWDTMVQAEFSTPFAAAMAVAGDEPGPKWYSTGRFKAPEIFELASKVKFVKDPKAYQIALDTAVYVCTAEVKTRDGKVRRATIEYEKGIPENPLSEAEIYQKFMVNARDIIAKKQAEQLWERLLDIEKVKSLKEIAPLLS